MDTEGHHARRQGGRHRSRCPNEIFGLEPRADLIQRCVNWQLAKRQRGTHKTKKRGEICAHRQEDVQAEGHRRRPSRRARASAVPRRRPRVRSGRAQPCARSAEEGARARAASRAVGQGEGRRHGRDRQGRSRMPRPRRCAASSASSAGERADHRRRARSRQNFASAARNIPNIDVLPIQGINVYDILRREKLVLTKAALDALEARFK